MTDTHTTLAPHVGSWLEAVDHYDTLTVLTWRRLGTRKRQYMALTASSRIVQLEPGCQILTQIAANKWRETQPKPEGAA